MGEVGYKKPPQNRQFSQPGGNPQGATSAQRKAEIANAELATRLRARLLTALEGVMNEHPEKEKIVGELLKADVLRLIKESEDRGLGTAVQSVNVESPAGSMTPARIEHIIVWPDKKPQ